MSPAMAGWSAPASKKPEVCDGMMTSAWPKGGTRSTASPSNPDPGGTASTRPLEARPPRRPVPIRVRLEQDRPCHPMDGRLPRRPV